MLVVRLNIGGKYMCQNIVTQKSVKKYRAIDNTEYMEELVRKRGTNRKIKYDQKKIA